MAIWVLQQKTQSRVYCIGIDTLDTGRNQLRVIRGEVGPSYFKIALIDERLPMGDVVCLPIFGNRSAGSWGYVFQQLNAGSMRCTQARDPQACPEYIVQVLLLISIVLARPLDAHAEFISIEGNALFGIVHSDRGVVDS